MTVTAPLTLCVIVSVGFLIKRLLVGSVVNHKLCEKIVRDYVRIFNIV